MKPEDLAAAPPARLPFPITRSTAEAVECRAGTPDDGIGLMTGRFSTFNDWYEVDSWIEGHFLERIAPGAFRKTIAESRAQMKVLYDHGQDPQIGNKVLGPIRDLEPNASYGVPLFDTSYNRDLLPGLQAGVYGSSFRFTVEKDAWDRSPERSANNPEAIPERTITEARVFEFGPVTFPANPNATAGVRSTTDDFYQQALRSDPGRYDQLLRSAQSARTPADAGAATPTAEPPAATPDPEPAEQGTPRAEEQEPEAPAPTRRKPAPISAEDFLAQLRQE
jgi:HK97 family phage prohead protease